jgi:hypothetical protein
LARCATAAGATLTPDHVAMTRAANAMMKLDAMVDRLKRNGGLQEFNARYKAGRAAALAHGRGFVGYGIALARLKRALIPMLQQGRPLAGVFDEIFR